MGEFRKLSLNEVFAAEKDVSSTSSFRLTVDGKDIGKFKSSGIIMSTGTGSSGWLYSARMISKEEIMGIQQCLGLKINEEAEDVRSAFTML